MDGQGRPRSPAFPSIDLEKAIERATTLYKKEGRHSVPREIAFDHWGYTEKSGMARLSVAAMRYFGLIGWGQDKQLTLTELALDILTDNRDDSHERQEAIRRAALAPRIHKDIWDKYGGELPSNATLRFFLVRDRRFTENGVDEFLKQFRRTIAFSGLSKADISQDKEEPLIEEELDRPAAQSADTPYLPPPAREAVQEMVRQELREIRLPLAIGVWASLTADFPLTETEWKQLMTVLEAMKPALIKEQETDNSED